MCIADKPQKAETTRCTGFSLLEQSSGHLTFKKSPKFGAGGPGFYNFPKTPHYQATTMHTQLWAPNSRALRETTPSPQLQLCLLHPWRMEFQKTAAVFLLTA